MGAGGKYHGNKDKVNKKRIRIRNANQGEREREREREREKQMLSELNGEVR